MLSSDRFNAAIANIDQSNAADPHREWFDGKEIAKEVLYSQRMTAWLHRLSPDASETLRLAARGQHICRWTIPRNRFPMDRAGYHRWRSDCQRMHAEKLGEIMQAAGYSDNEVARAQSLVRKERLKLDPESQLLEDVICLVFLESYFADFAKQHDEAKLIDIVRKTWKKMSPRGHEAALKLPMAADARKIVEQALAAP
ncbi:MAG: DUF4202 domain-containing protein [Pirellulales bacterium]|nr:DUF4202 domain-containing protein [Pirellulales bacterium]